MATDRDRLDMFTEIKAGHHPSGQQTPQKPSTNSPGFSGCGSVIKGLV